MSLRLARSSLPEDPIVSEFVLIVLGDVPVVAVMRAVPPAFTVRAARFCGALKFVTPLTFNVSTGVPDVPPALVLRFRVPDELIRTVLTPCDCVPLIVRVPTPVWVRVLPAAIE